SSDLTEAGGNPPFVSTVTLFNGEVDNLGSGRNAQFPVEILVKDDQTIEMKLDKQVLGLRLPLDGLVWWLSALPRPEVEFSAAAGEDGRMASLDQDGWHIEYSRYQQRGERWLPGRIFVSRGELEFRLVVDSWEAL
ncbi:MAG: outer membrane lipoprotein LolB, partial [Thiobacillus sp.]|nr:outer membrane lipoprotein LolB [Thiobacillus sp.]